VTYRTDNITVAIETVGQSTGQYSLVLKTGEGQSLQILTIIHSQSGDAITIYPSNAVKESGKITESDITVEERNRHLWSINSNYICWKYLFDIQTFL